MKREIKIFSNDLQKKNTEIMPDSPVEYLRNGKNHAFCALFPTGFSLLYSIFTHVFVNAGSAVGFSDCEWADCKILQKYHEDKVLWADIELRFNSGQKHLKMIVCLLHAFR